VTPTGYIQIAKHAIPAGPVTLEQLAYDWRGGDIVAISHELMKELFALNDIYIGNVVSVGPYRIKLIDRDIPMSAWMGVRVRNPFNWRVGVARLWFTKTLYIIKGRLIVTLAVWNLARYDPATTKAWRDVYILDRMAKWLFR